MGGTAYVGRLGNGSVCCSRGAAAPIREAVTGLAAEVAALRQSADGTEIAAAIAAQNERIDALEAAVTALVPAPETANVAAGAALRGTGVEPETTTFGEELRRRLFDLGAALRRGLGG